MGRQLERRGKKNPSMSNDGLEESCDFPYKQNNDRETKEKEKGDFQNARS